MAAKGLPIAAYIVAATPTKPNRWAAAKTSLSKNIATKAPSDPMFSSFSVMYVIIYTFAV
jgi:hypothetical protein